MLPLVRPKQNRGNGSTLRPSSPQTAASEKLLQVQSAVPESDAPGRALVVLCICKGVNLHGGAHEDLKPAHASALSVIRHLAELSKRVGE